MHLKYSLVSVLAASTASASVVLTHGEGLFFANEYAHRNLNEICFSRTPIPSCNSDYVIHNSKAIKVDFHCLNKKSIMAQKWSDQVEQNMIIDEVSGKSSDIYGRVIVPTSCMKKTRLSLGEQLRREKEQEHGHRVELFTDETDYTNDSEWKTYERYSDEDQYQIYRKNYENENKEWKTYDIESEYPDLSKQKYLNQMVFLNEYDFEKVRDQLRQLVSSKKISKILLPEVQTVLPTYFSQVGKQLHEMMNNNYKDQTKYINSDLQSLRSWVSDYEKYKGQLQRIYNYIVKEIVVLNKNHSTRLVYTSDLVRKVWENIQKQMTRNQIENIEIMLEHVQKTLEMVKTETELSDLLVDKELKSIHQATRKNLMRIILTGLQINNNNNFN